MLQQVPSSWQARTLALASPRMGALGLLFGPSTSLAHPVPHAAYRNPGGQADDDGRSAAASSDLDSDALEIGGEQSGPLTQLAAEMTRTCHSC